MTLSNFENFVPPHIYGCEERNTLKVVQLPNWKRQNRVNGLRKVEGTKDYEVEVSIEGKRNCILGL